MCEMKAIYLDYNATGPVAEEVAAAMEPFLRQCWGNPSSQHSFGREAKAAVEAAREQTAAFIGAHPDEIVFTHGGTESNNLALQGFCDAGEATGRQIVSSPLEHSSVYGCLRKLSRRGCQILELPVDATGTVVADALEELLSPATILLSVMTAGNESGTIQPLRRIAGIAHEHGVTVHSDAVQAAGRIPIDVDELSVDMLSLSGHKISGPKGVGVLYIRRGTEIEALFRGGQQEGGRMPGTENVPAIVGMGAACELAGRELARESARVAGLRDRLETLIRQNVAGVKVNGNPACRLPNTSSISFPGRINTELVERLDFYGVAVSGGSACGSRIPEPSRALLASGLTPEEALGTLRFSLGRENTEADIDRAAAIVATVLNNHSRS